MRNKWSDCSERGKRTDSGETTQVDVGQPTPVSISFTPIAFGTVELFVSSPSARTLARLVADQSHAPPILSPPTVLPLRI